MGLPVYYTTTLWHVVTPRRACGGNIWSDVKLKHRPSGPTWAQDVDSDMRSEPLPTSQRFIKFISHSFLPLLSPLTLPTSVHCQHHQEPSTAPSLPSDICRPRLSARGVECCLSMCVTYAAQPGRGSCVVGAERDITFGAKTKRPNTNPMKLPSGVLNCQPSESAHVAFY